MAAPARPTGGSPGVDKTPPPPPPPPAGKPGEPTTKPPAGKEPPPSEPKYINGTSNQVLAGAAEALAGQVQAGQKSADDLLFQKFYSPDAKTPDAKAKEDKRRAAAADSEKSAQRYADQDKRAQSGFEAGEQKDAGETLKRLQERGHDAARGAAENAQKETSQKQVNQKSAAADTRKDTRLDTPQLMGKLSQFLQNGDKSSAQEKLETAKTQVPERTLTQQESGRLNTLLQRMMVAKRAQQQGDAEKKALGEQLEKAVQKDLAELKAEDPKLGQIAESAMAEVDKEFKETKEAQETKEGEAGEAKEGGETKGLSKDKQVQGTKREGKETGGEKKEGQMEDVPPEMAPQVLSLTEAIEVRGTKFVSTSGPTSRTEGEAKIEGDLQTGRLGKLALEEGVTHYVGGENCPPPHRVLSRGRRNPHDPEAVHVFKKKSTTVAVRYTIGGREYVELKDGKPTGKLVNPWATMDPDVIADVKANLLIRTTGFGLVKSKKAPPGPPAYFGATPC